MAQLNVDYLIKALETVSEGLMIVNQDMTILYRNVSAKLILDGPEKAFTFDDYQYWNKEYKVFDVKTQKELSYNELPLVRAMNGLKYTGQLIHVVTKQNPEGSYLSFNGIPLIGDDNSIVGAVITFRDITKAYIAEKRINHERAFYKNILDWIPAEIFVHDRGEFVFKNHLFEKHEKELQKANWKISEETLKKLDENDALVMRKFQAIEFDEFLDFPDGKRQYRTIRFPIYHQVTDKVLICVIAFDVTEKVAMEEKMENERVNSINASKLAAIGTLAGEIGHEINNPIATIRGVTFLIREMMADKLLTTKQLTEKLDTIDTTVNRIAKIVRSLKNLSRKSSNEKMESCLLRNIFQDVLALCDIGLKKNNIHLEIDKSNRLMDLTISCYQIQFSQVLINIITNAIDAVEGQVNAWIKITLTEDNDNIFIHVKDSGPGIPNDHRSKIFDAFYTTKKLGKGTGLGLSISKNIMEAHEGDIYLAPLEEGSVFIIRLPKHAEKMINEAQTG